MQKLDIKMTQRPRYVKRRFDFEIGYLSQSPCRKCRKRGGLPKCSENCNLIDMVQEFLAASLSCSRVKE